MGRATINTLPLKKLPEIIIIKLVYYVVLWLNDSPAKTRILKHYSSQ